MRWCLGVLLVAGCGRSHFDDAGQDTGIVGGTGDEDQDGVADAADNCPAHFNQGQADRDGDGVGDTCDPHPDAAGDKLVSASFFASGFGNWTPDQAASWMIQGGRLVTTAAPDSTNARISLSVAAPQGTMEIAYTVLDFGPDVTNYTGVINATLTTPGNSWSCRLVNNNSLAELDLLQTYVDASNYAARPLSNTVRAGQAAELWTTRDAAQLQCRTPDSEIDTSLATTEAVSNSTIQIYGMQVALDFVMVYAVP